MKIVYESQTSSPSQESSLLRASLKSSLESLFVRLKCDSTWVMRLESPSLLWTNIPHRNVDGASQRLSFILNSHLSLALHYCEPIHRADCNFAYSSEARLKGDSWYLQNRYRALELCSQLLFFTISAEINIKDKQDVLCVNDTSYEFWCNWLGWEGENWSQIMSVTLCSDCRLRSNFFVGLFTLLFLMWPLSDFSVNRSPYWTDPHAQKTNTNKYWQKQTNTEVT